MALAILIFSEGFGTYLKFFHKRSNKITPKKQDFDHFCENKQNCNYSHSFNTTKLNFWHVPLNKNIIVVFLPFVSQFTAGKVDTNSKGKFCKQSLGQIVTF